MFDHMTLDELIVAYNAGAKPNAYGAEVLRRIHEQDREEFGMYAEYLGGVSSR